MPTDVTLLPGSAAKPLAAAARQIHEYKNEATRNRQKVIAKHQIISAEFRKNALHILTKN
jgi:2-keto-3-deoxy-galactonokinase